jgi:hypothetical protein
MVRRTPLTAPIVRDMVICDDCRSDPNNSHLAIIVGVLNNINSIDLPSYPLLYRKMCVFLALTEGRGHGEGQIVCVIEETGQEVFATPKREITFGPDPLAIEGVVFRIRDCPFPVPGMYSIQFWYNGVEASEHPLLLR